MQGLFYSNKVLLKVCRKCGTADTGKNTSTFYNFISGRTVIEQQPIRQCKDCREYY